MSGARHIGAPYCAFIAVFYIVGMAQYAPDMVFGLMRGNVVLWTIGIEQIQSGGMLRFVKDFFVVVWGGWWLLSINRRPLVVGLASVFRLYVMWMFCVIFVGLAAFLFMSTPSFFLKAGVRWLLLVHAAVGFFFVSAVAVQFLKKDHYDSLGLFFIVVLVADSLLILLQLSKVGLVYGLGLAESRLTGVFSNAGVAGYFAVSCAVLALALYDIGKKVRLLIVVLALFVAAASGTRFAMISIFLILILMFDDFLKSAAMAKFRRLYVIVFLVLSGCASFFMYEAMISAVGRGGILEAQLNEGGRLFNLVKYLSIIITSDLNEFILGRGLGVGTNTAYNLIASSGGNPSDYRYNWLVDNAFLTTYFQIGALGVFVFFSGVWLFLSYICKFCSPVGKKECLLVVSIFVGSMFSGNPFEQYYLIIPYLAGLALISFNTSYKRGNV